MKTSLVLISFLGLFLELIFIRWLPANIFSLAYFSNIVLISSFLGLGLGFLLASKQKDLFKYFPITLLGVVTLFIILRQIGVVLPHSATEVVWSYYYPGNWIVFPKIQIGILSTLIIVFILNTLPFILIGQKTGLLMQKFTPLKAYALNILGALFGTIVFSIFSIIGGKLSSPTAWFIGAGVTGLWFLRENKRHLSAGIICILVMAPMLYISSKNEIWSPYYSILVKESSINYNSFDVYENRFLYQRVLDLKSNIDYRDAYSLPYTLKTSPQKVLILGAGTGNDVATAVMHDVPEIQAVEIDPAIAEIGKRLHPNRPYQSSNVTLFIDDARSFIKKSKDKYDMIILGTLDSHALLSAMSTVRLENFVYTVESLKEIKNHLNNDGVVVLMFSVPEQWLGNKLVKSVLTVFDETKPIVYVGGSSHLFNLMMIAGPGLTDILKTHPLATIPFRQISENYFDAQNLSTDDWPYLYLLKHTIPSFYVEVIAFLIALSFVGIWYLSFKNKNTFKLVGWPSLNFFSLGSAFLLLETKSITTLSLLFGSTWLVNAFVFSGILIMVLLANTLVYRINIRRIEFIYIYIFLGLSLALNYFLPTSSFLGIGFWLRSITSAFLVALPLFFASIIFSYNLKSVKDIGAMFGVNLMGAVFGGFLEYISMATGLKFLYILAAIIYLVSFLALRADFKWQF